MHRNACWNFACFCANAHPYPLCENDGLSQGKQQRVLIVRLGAMGDILHALPAVSALRAAHPQIDLGWACEPQWRALFAADSADDHAARTLAQPLVDRLHCVPAKAWAKHPLRPTTLAGILQNRRELRDVGYDAALDLQGALRSAVLARWARPARLLGEDNPRESAARLFFEERIPSTGVHVIEQAADVARALYGDPLPLGLPALPHDETAKQWCTEAGVREDLGPSVLLHSGAGWGAKRWPVERYAQAAALIAQETGARIIINAAPGELELGHALAGQLKEPLQNAGLSPALLLSPTVGQLIELSRRISLAIGGDTGPLHLAAALGKPTIGIFGPTDPARNGPFHGVFRIFRDPSSKRDHTRHKQPEAGLLRIAPASVAEAAIELLQSGAEARATAAAPLPGKTVPA
jgi:heptosyltransferase-1